MEVHQIVSGFRTGDAIGNFALELQGYLKEAGFKSNIYSIPEHTCIDLKDTSIDFKKHVPNKDNILIYHFSLGSPATDYFKTVADKKIMIYHNITPAKFFRAFEPKTAKTLENGREELKTLAGIPDIAVGVSKYNCSELQEAGFKQTEILPLTIVDDYLKTEPSAKVIKECKKSKGKVILSVGRIAPNKKIEDIIKTFYIYKKTIDPMARLILVGGYEETDGYYQYLKTMITDLYVQDITFAKHTPLNELLAYFKGADAYLTLSEHEGFCVPLIEAMHFELPVFAYGSSAIPETLNGAGILIKKKDHKRIAELLNTVLTNQEICDKIITGQNNRLKDFKPENTKNKFLEIVNRCK